MQHTHKKCATTGENDAQRTFIEHQYDNSSCSEYFRRRE
jgi:hypothetical protein